MDRHHKRSDHQRTHATATHTHATTTHTQRLHTHTHTHAIMDTRADTPLTRDSLHALGGLAKFAKAEQYPGSTMGKADQFALGADTWSLRSEDENTVECDRYFTQFYTMFSENPPARVSLGAECPAFVLGGVRCRLVGDVVVPEEPGELYSMNRWQYGIVTHQLAAHCHSRKYLTVADESSTSIMVKLCSDHDSALSTVIVGGVGWIGFTHDGLIDGFSVRNAEWETWLELAAEDCSEAGPAARRQDESGLAARRQDESGSAARRLDESPPAARRLDESSPAARRQAGGDWDQMCL